LFFSSRSIGGSARGVCVRLCGPGPLRKTGRTSSSERFLKPLAGAFRAPQAVAATPRRVWGWRSPRRSVERQAAGSAGGHVLRDAGGDLQRVRPAARLTAPEAVVQRRFQEFFRQGGVTRLTSCSCGRISLAPSGAACRCALTALVINAWVERRTFAQGRPPAGPSLTFADGGSISRLRQRARL